jgi:hypothetical protein
MELQDAGTRGITGKPEEVSWSSWVTSGLQKSRSTVALNPHPPHHVQTEHVCLIGRGSRTTKGGGFEVVKGGPAKIYA